MSDDYSEEDHTESHQGPEPPGLRLKSVGNNHTPRIITLRIKEPPEPMLNAANWRERGCAYQWFSGTDTYLYRDVRVVGFTKAYIRGRENSERKLLAWIAFKNCSIISEECLNEHTQDELAVVYENSSAHHFVFQDDFGTEDNLLEEVFGEPGVWQHLQPLEITDEGQPKQLMVTWHPVPVNSTSLCPIARKYLLEMLQDHSNETHYVLKEYFQGPPDVADAPSLWEGKSLFAFYTSLVDYIINFHTFSDFYPFCPLFAHLGKIDTDFAKELSRDEAEIMSILNEAPEFLYIDTNKAGNIDVLMFRNCSKRQITRVTRNVGGEMLTIKREDIFICMSNNIMPRPLPQGLVEPARNTISQDGTESGMEVSKDSITPRVALEISDDNTNEVGRKVVEEISVRAGCSSSMHVMTSLPTCENSPLETQDVEMEITTAIITPSSVEGQQLINLAIDEVKEHEGEMKVDEKQGNESCKATDISTHHSVYDSMECEGTGSSLEMHNNIAFDEDERQEGESLGKGEQGQGQCDSTDAIACNAVQEQGEGEGKEKDSREHKNDIEQAQGTDLHVSALDLSVVRNDL